MNENTNGASMAPDERAQAVRDLVHEMERASTSGQLELMRAALMLIADAMEPCEDCGRTSASLTGLVIESPDVPDVQADTGTEGA